MTSFAYSISQVYSTYLSLITAALFMIMLLAPIVMFWQAWKQSRLN